MLFRFLSSSKVTCCDKSERKSERIITMSKIKWRGGALIAPLPPVMVSCGDMEKSNIITVAWTGIINTIPPKTYISVRPKRYSYDIIKESGEFVINLTTDTLVRSADFCGMFTGRKVDKFAKCGLTKEPGDETGCPMIAESPISIECRVCGITPLGTHDMLLADILAVHVDEKLIDSKGKLCIEKAHLAAYAHGEYYALGKKLGSFGFAATKKSKSKKAKNKPNIPQEKQ